MPQSMTGFGRAESRGRGPRLLCEARSVNHRFLTTKIRLPAQLQRLESWVDGRVQSRFQRGSVEVAIFWRGAGETLAARLDEKVADRYLASLRAYLKKRKLAPDVDPGLLIGLPGVMAAPDPDEIARDFKPKPAVYLMTAAALNLQPNEVMMVAAHSDDLRQAALNGLRTAHIARPGENGPGTGESAPRVPVDFAAKNMEDLARQLGV